MRYRIGALVAVVALGLSVTAANAFEIEPGFNNPTLGPGLYSSNTVSENNTGSPFTDTAEFKVSSTSNAVGGVSPIDLTLGGGLTTVSDITNLTISLLELDTNGNVVATLASGSSSFNYTGFLDPSAQYELDVSGTVIGTAPKGSWMGALQISAVPLPATLVLFGTGLAMLGFFGWRKRQDGAAIPA